MESRLWSGISEWTSGLLAVDERLRVLETLEALVTGLLRLKWLELGWLAISCLLRVDAITYLTIILICLRETGGMGV